GLNGTIMRGSSNRELRINIRYSAGDQPHAESVHHDMMIARIPIEPVISRFEQSVPEQRSASWLDRPCQISLHPRFRSGARVRLGADIDNRHRPRGWRANELPWVPSVFNDLHTQCVRFGDNLS